MLKCPNHTVEAESEKTATLPCVTEPQTDVRTVTVEWVFKDAKEQIHDVHVYRRRKDDFEEQTEKYKGRTSVSHEALSSGNCSLSLRVATSFAGTYMCSVRNGTEVHNCSLTLSGQYTVAHAEFQTECFKSYTLFTVAVTSLTHMYKY